MEQVEAIGNNPGERPLSFLATKFHIPRLPIHYVARSRLIGLLDQGVQERLTLLSAPAGSGKTTLLAAWARNSSVPISWLSLEDADNDPARFLAYLTAALTRLNVHTKARDVALLRIAYEQSWEQILTDFVNDLAQDLTQESVLILDDYHLITSEPIHAALSFLIDHMPSQLHLLIGTRSDPPFALPRLRARGQLAELGTKDLCFSSSEIQEFLQAMELDLPAEALRSLEQQTQGWIVGMHLLALLLRGQSNPVAVLQAHPGSHRFFMEYISDEILALRSPAVRDFLLQTSVLERLTGPLCDAVTGQTDGQARLEELYRKNLLLNTLDDTGTWYSYHPLFAETLRAHLHKRQPDLLPELYRRASYWYEQQHAMEEACDYAFLAQDMPRAATLFAELLTHLIEQGRLERLSNWLEQLPPEIVAQSPQLCVASIWMQSWYTRSPQDRENVIERMEQVIQARQHDTAIPWIVLQSEIAIFQANHALQQNDPSRTISLIQEALYALSTDKAPLSRFIAFRLRIILSMAYRRTGDMRSAERMLLDSSIPQPGETYYPLNLVAAWILTEQYEAQGNLRKIEQLYDAIFLALKRDNDFPPLPFALIQISKAHLFYEWNRLPEAAHLVQYMLEIARQMDQIAFSAITLLSLWIRIRLARAQGHSTTAWQLFQEQQKQLRYQKLPLIKLEHSQFSSIFARIALDCRQETEVQHWEEAHAIDPDDALETSLEIRRYFEVITLVRVLIARGRLHNNAEGAFAQAMKLLDRLREVALHLSFNGWYIEIQMLTALVLLAQNQKKQALYVLGPALALAEPEGYVRLFADEGQPMAALLSQVAGWTTASPAYIRLLQEAVLPAMSALPAPPEAPPSQSLQLAPPVPSRPMQERLYVDPLSTREQEVLFLLATGASNQHIADQLVISLNTAKRHVKHILAKLAVSNRTQAVARARELRLLPS